MTLLSWSCVLAVAVAAFLFGQTARPGERPRDARRRLGVALSLSGPLAVFLGGLTLALVTGAWLPVAAATAAVVLLAATAGAALAP